MVSLLPRMGRVVKGQKFRLGQIHWNYQCVKKWKNKHWLGFKNYVFIIKNTNFPDKFNSVDVNDLQIKLVNWLAIVARPFSKDLGSNPNPGIPTTYYKRSLYLQFGYLNRGQAPLTWIKNSHGIDSFKSHQRFTNWHSFKLPTMDICLTGIIF